MRESADPADNHSKIREMQMLPSSSSRLHLDVSFHREAVAEVERSGRRGVVRIHTHRAHVTLWLGRLAAMLLMSVGVWLNTDLILSLAHGPTKADKEPTQNSMLIRDATAP